MKKAAKGFVLLIMLTLISGWESQAQNIRYQVDGLNKYVGCGDGNGNPEPVINCRVNDNLNGNYSNWNNSGNEIAQGWWGVTNYSWRNYGSYSGYTNIRVQLRGYERDPGFSGNDCNFGYSTVAYETIRNRAPCNWHQFWDYGGAWGVRWRYYYQGQGQSGYNTWIGYNNNWMASYNWSLCQVPTNGHNVYIPRPSRTIGNVNPVIPSGNSGRANTITIDASNGAVVNIQGTAQLLIN